MGDFGFGMAIGPGAVMEREFSVEMSIRTFWAASTSVLVNLDLVTTGFTILALDLVEPNPLPLARFSLLLEIPAPVPGNLGILGILVLA